MKAAVSHVVSQISVFFTVESRIQQLRLITEKWLVTFRDCSDTKKYQRKMMMAV